MLKYFIVKASEIDLDNERLLSQFSDERLQKLNSIKNEGTKRLCAAAEISLINAVKHFYPNDSLPVKYNRGEHGKPYLSDHAGLYVNISHSGDYAVCAVSDYPIGIDLQQIRNINFKLCKKYFTEEEQAYVGSDKLRFFEIWSKKESRVKATGTGITVSLKNFSVLRDDENFKFIKLTPPEYGYVMYSCLQYNFDTDR